MPNQSLGAFLEGKDLFSAINAIEPFPFIGTDAENLNLILIINHGKKWLFDGYETLTVEQVAGLIVKQYSEAWNNYIQIEGLKTNLNKRREVTETIDEREDRTGNRTDTNKVAAFNSPSMVDNDGSISDSTDGMTGNKTRETVDETINPESTYSLLNTMARDSILKHVMEDISKELTLSIY